MTEPQDNTRRAWSWRHAFASSNLPATTKAVLHTLGMFMNEFGESCYPTVADICRYSGFDKKTVLKHLSSAREAGWIAISLHGYRGQKWKRQEYAARWPERDLVAACPPSDSGQGGGTIPPPSQTSNAVEFVPEGGGIEGSKVVEQVHQDKTSPINIPKTNPSERGASANDQEDRKKIEKAYWKLVRSWPKLEGTPQAKWFDSWLALTPEDRILAAEKRDAWVELLRSNGRDHIHVPGTYFENKLWEQVPDAPTVSTDQPARLEAKPFGKLFGIEVYRNFLTVSPGMISAPTAFERAQIERSERTEGEIYREKLVKQGWTDVEGMFERAATGRSIVVSGRLASLSDRMESVSVGSDRWIAWKAYHEERGWRWYPSPDWLKWVCFPSGGPDGMKEFETALRGIGDDDGR